MGLLDNFFGAREGFVKTLYKSGEKQYEGHIKDGKQYGLWTGFYESGQKKNEVHFEKG
ncbi:MAG: hypothetical protein HN942_07285, partial [Methylococcales bacterium]|nr:hypothetical protein [Methylococcales bacterium]